MVLRIKKILSQKGMTLKDLSRLSGITQSNLSNYLNGNISPTLDTLIKIASHLKVDIRELFGEEDDIELYAKYKGELHPISKKDIIDLISKKHWQAFWRSQLVTSNKNYFPFLLHIRKIKRNFANEL